MPNFKIKYGFKLDKYDVGNSSKGKCMCEEVCTLESLYCICWCVCEWKERG